MNYKEVVKWLELEPLLPEGGYFRRTHESSLKSLFFGSERLHTTSIYYLIHQNNFSALHVLSSTEVFHFYAGDAVDFFTVSDQGMSKMVLGIDFEKGERPQLVVEPGVWQGCKLREGGVRGWALLGCTVVPGFEYADFRMINRAELRERYPQFFESLKELVR